MPADTYDSDEHNPDIVEHPTEYHKVLHTVFGLAQFRDQQLEAITSIVEGNDTLVIFPTGAGKSLIYQLAAVYSKKTAVVISPLISLMDDQVTKLRSLGITAFTVNSSTSMNTRIQAFDRMRTNPESISLLYVTPETFRLEEFVHLLKGMVTNNLVGFIAVDECHVLTDWGNTFRSSYRGLSSLRTNFPGIPIIALTATATKYTAIDIVSCLRLNSSFKLFIRSFDRRNLYYRILYVGPNSSKIVLLLDYLRTYQACVTGSRDLTTSRHIRTEQRSKHRSCSVEYPKSLGAVIVYCYTRDETEAVARRLADEGFNAQHFHAKLSQDTKMQILMDWVKDDSSKRTSKATDSNDMQIIVATIAFGMGIDRSNVRLVVHYNIPRSMEGFYQESGRAGRDSEPALSLVLFDGADVSGAVTRIQRDGSDFELYSLYSFFSFCLQRKCRRRVLLDYFNSGVEDHSTDPVWCCDFCSGRSPSLTTAYSDILDGVMGKLSYYRNDRGDKFLGCLSQLLITQDNQEPSLKQKSLKTQCLTVSTKCSSSQKVSASNVLTEPQVRSGNVQKYERAFRAHMKNILLHLSSESLARKLNEVHLAISTQADGDSATIESCYKKLYAKTKAMTTYPTEDNVYALIFSFFGFTCL
ncbi:Sgs1 DNA helicase, putative [Giardia lamblia P15]|uniref:DNA 3'-5' helicase n=1 Tax=Giardia intestinalis (strain P15) TaxID=658858 RepID=E1F9P9_GIAIA|nr:Sgs1 DNA helicase, putative [Giardia lamblia P15]